MDIVLHIDTKKLSTDFSEAINEYTKRISPFGKMITKTYKDISKLSPDKNSKTFIICSGTCTIDSVALANSINELAINGYSSSEYIFTDSNKKNNIENILSERDIQYTYFNISSFDLSIEMAATVMAEQLYRAYTIQNNIKYHK